MARNAARRVDRKRGSEDAPAKGHEIVQPVAQRSGVERLKESAALACADNQDASARAFIPGLRDC
jgi:hypothetical protein